MDFFFIFMLFLSNFLAWRIVTKKFKYDYLNLAFLYVGSVLLSRTITDMLYNLLGPSKEIIKDSWGGVFAAVGFLILTMYLNYFLVPGYMLQRFASDKEYDKVTQRVLKYSFLFNLLGNILLMLLIFTFIKSGSVLAVTILKQLGLV